jgi:hypothetical protein
MYDYMEKLTNTGSKKINKYMKYRTTEVKISMTFVIDFK